MVGEEYIFAFTETVKKEKDAQLQVEHRVAGIVEALVLVGSAMRLIRKLLWNSQSNNSNLVHMKIYIWQLLGGNIFVKLEFIRYVANIMHESNYIWTLSSI